MPIPQRLTDLAARIGLPPQRPVRNADQRDPKSGRDQAKTATLSDSFGEHFMNKNQQSTPARHHAEPHRPLVRQIGNRVRVTSGQRLALALFDRAGPLARLVRHTETQWTSATFSGARHTLVLRFAGLAAVADAEALTLAIADDAISVPRALIAEITVTRFSQTLLPEPAAELEIAALLLDQ